jgi:hypothetical protein
MSVLTLIFRIVEVETFDRCVYTLLPRFVLFLPKYWGHDELWLFHSQKEISVSTLSWVEHQFGPFEDANPVLFEQM